MEQLPSLRNRIPSRHHICRRIRSEVCVVLRSRLSRLRHHLHPQHLRRSIHFQSQAEGHQVKRILFRTWCYTNLTGGGGAGGGGAGGGRGGGDGSSVAGSSFNFDSGNPQLRLCQLGCFCVIRRNCIVYVIISTLVDFKCLE